jgi:predicted nucleic acid-binding protein
MSGLVVDASVVVAWLFDDEEEPRADRVLERLEEDGALVPQLWHLETRNSLLVAERRGRLSAGGVKERLDALKGLPIRTDEEPDLQSAFDLARAHGLSFYDALYLELAKRESTELATLDGALGRATVAEGVSLSVT